MPRKPNVTTIKIGRYASSAVAMPAPETPTASSSNGNQQQLDAMIAETTVPILAMSSPRLADPVTEVFCNAFAVAPGNLLAFDAQQS